MIFAPLSHQNNQFQQLDAIAQCDRCLQTSSYDLLDGMLRKPLTCRCGGSLRLFQFGNRKGITK